MAYTASQNPKTGTTYTAAALFATLILAAGIAALAMYPAEAFAKPLCVGVGACVNDGGCGYALGHRHGICNGPNSGCQRAQNCPNR